MTKHDWQAAFGAPDASFDATVRQTLDHLEEEPKMLKISMRTVVLALALLLALTGVVYAATTGFRIGDYFGRRGPGSVPQDFDTGFDRDYTQELCGLRFHIRDAYVDGDILIALTEISRIDGQPAIFLTDGIFEDNPIDVFDQTLSWELRDGRSIQEYAQENDLPVYRVGNEFEQGAPADAVGDEWAEEDFRYLVTFTEMEGIQSEQGEAALSWNILVQDENGEFIQQSMQVSLPVESFTQWEVAVNQAVEGLPVVVDSLRFQQSRVELKVDIAYHLDMEKMPDVAENDESAAGFRYRFIHLCDPADGRRLPQGARLLGTLRWLNEEHTAFEGALGSVSGQYAGDTIRLGFYDPWLDEYVGFLDVKIR